MTSIGSWARDLLSSGGVARAGAKLEVPRLSSPRERAGVLPVDRLELNAEVGRRVEMLERLARTVPFQDTALDATGKPRLFPRTRPAQPWEDAGENKAPRVVGERTVADALPKLLGPRGHQALQLWASGPRAELWDPPLGQALARFGMQRYGAALGHTGRSKLGHGIGVLHFSQALHGAHPAAAALSPEWQRLLEYGALLHDIGYMNGGRMHSGKGGLDLLYNLEAHLKAAGVDGFTQGDIEKLAALVELHGTAFPWDAVDKRLATERYVDPALAMRLTDTAPGRATVRAKLREENAAYLRDFAGRNPLAFLEDEDQLRQLLRAGWLLHSADNFNGPKHPIAVKGEPEARFIGRQRLGRERPLRTIQQLDKAT